MNDNQHCRGNGAWLAKALIKTNVELKTQKRAKSRVWSVQIVPDREAVFYMRFSVKPLFCKGYKHKSNKVGICSLLALFSKDFQLKAVCFSERCRPAYDKRTSATVGKPKLHHVATAQRWFDTAL